MASTATTTTTPATASQKLSVAPPTLTVPTNSPAAPQPHSPREFSSEESSRLEKEFNELSPDLQAVAAMVTTLNVGYEPKFIKSPKSDAVGPQDSAPAA